MTIKKFVLIVIHLRAVYSILEYFNFYVKNLHDTRYRLPVHFLNFVGHINFFLKAFFIKSFRCYSFYIQLICDPKSLSLDILYRDPLYFWSNSQPSITKNMSYSESSNLSLFFLWCLQTFNVFMYLMCVETKGWMDL